MKKNKELKFSSKYELDLPTYQEFSKYYLKSNKNIFIILAIFILCTIINLIFKNYKFVWTYSILIFLIIFFFYLFMKRNIILNYKRMQESRGEEHLLNLITITANEIIIEDQNNNNRTSYNFSQIIGIIESPNLLILKLKYNLGLIIAKNNLEGGTIKELETHLLTSCQKLKKPTILNPQKYNLFYYLCGLILILLFAIALILNYKSTSFIKKLKANLEADGYIFNNMYPDDPENSVYEVFKENDHTIVYIYEYESTKVANSNFNTWLDPENSPEVFTCLKKDDYKLCESNTTDYSSKLLLKDRFITYGNTETLYKQELDTIINKINS